MPQTGAKTSALIQGQTRPIHSISVVDGTPYICICNVEQLIRHVFWVNAVKDGKIGRTRPVSRVSASVGCD